MDPRATYAILCNENENYASRLAAACNLLTWLHRGGFAPDGQSATALIAHCEAFLDGRQV